MRQSGFTIIELMVVVTIAGVLAAFALPYMKNVILNQRIRAASTEAHLSLLLARSEAIKRNSNINVTRSGATWDLGWTVTVAATGDLLRTSDALKNVDVACNTSGNPSGGTSACPTTVTFNNSGRPTSPIEFRFYNASNPNIFMRCVSISLSGQPHVEIDTDGNQANGCQ